MNKRITRNEVRAGIGHWPRKRPYRIIKECEAWVCEKCKQYPGIPEGFWWTEVYNLLQEAIHMKRAEG